MPGNGEGRCNLPAQLVEAVADHRIGKLRWPYSVCQSAQASGNLSARTITGQRRAWLKVSRGRRS
jgi:hypothetical protein